MQQENAYADVIKTAVLARVMYTHRRNQWRAQEFTVWGGGWN